MYKLVLANHPDYRITLHFHSDMRTEKVMVTFGGQPSGLDSEPFALKYIAKHGMDAISVAQRNGTQFQGLSVEDFYAAVSAEVSDRDVICYGSNLGAYAALYYGGSINARIIAASPFFPAWRPLKIRAYSDVDVRHLELTDVPKSSHRPTVIYDPMRHQDSRMVDLMVSPAYPAARILKLPYAGHTTLVTLSAARCLTPLIDGLVFRNELIDVTLPTEDSAIWHAEKGKSQIIKDPVRAEYHLERSLELSPARHTVAMLLNLHIRAGNLLKAQTIIDRTNLTENPRYKLIPSAKEAALKAGLCLG